MRSSWLAEHSEAMVVPSHLLECHERLRQLWLDHQDVFSYLSPERQWQLHDYFKPDKDFSDGELLEHYLQAAKERPDLPAQACEALAELQHILRGGKPAFEPVSVPNEKYGKRQGRLTVRALVRPEIDYDKIALATLLHAQRIVREEEGKPSDLDEDDYKRALSLTTLAKGEAESPKP